MAWMARRVATDLLHALCAIASLALPLVMAWLILGRDARPKRTSRQQKAPTPGRPGSQER